MGLVRFAVANLLEQAGVTVTVTDAASGFPKEHLFDRDLAFPWTALNATGDKQIQADQGASGTFGVTRALITGHNLVGLTCFLEYSDDAVAWSGYDGGAGSFVAAAGVIELPIAGHGPGKPGGVPEADQYPVEAVGLVARYWRLRIISPSSAPEVGELFLTREYELERNWRYGAPWSKQPNITVHRSPSGAAFKAKRGSTQRTLDIELSRVPTWFKVVFERREAELSDGLKPFWYWDLDDDATRYWMELTRPMQAVLSSHDSWALRISLMEAN
ncbi:hypothetical protein MYX64_06340 [Nitrospinae bacterium AH_259_B05_G02_I21]|nr:hypothetical protein [Nitrospinae bacterium AH_259_B05_G02_I21]